ncbi:MAG: glyoxalase, partial [Azorhizobium sp. 39-67-5]
MIPDMDAAVAFYGDVVGWGAQKLDMPEMPYTLFTTGADPIAGLMTLPQELRDRGVPPHWTGYVHVDDVDAAVAKAKALGGALHIEPRDIPGVGRFAVIGDPQGAVISLF